MSGGVTEHDHVRDGYQQVQLGPKAVEIPTDWELISLGNEEYAEVTMGGTPDTDVDEYWDGEVP